VGEVGEGGPGMKRCSCGAVDGAYCGDEEVHNQMDDANYNRTIRNAFGTWTREDNPSLGIAWDNVLFALSAIILGGLIWWSSSCG
jgi:hypothetical protein